MGYSDYGTIFVLRGAEKALVADLCDRPVVGIGLYNLPSHPSLSRITADGRPLDGAVRDCLFVSAADRRDAALCAVG